MLESGACAVCFLFFLEGLCPLRYEIVLFFVNIVQALSVTPSEEPGGLVGGLRSLKNGNLLCKCCCTPYCTCEFGLSLKPPCGVGAAVARGCEFGYTNPSMACTDDYGASFWPNKFKDIVMS